jgi:GNAT superfamily N-acetyltransferase
MRIRPFVTDHVAFGLALSREARWNQTEEDWRRALRLGGAGCFVAERDGEPVGTTMTCRFGNVAWIAMVLVKASIRRQGFGAALLRHALDYLTGRGVDSIWLDATPLGQPLMRSSTSSSKGGFFAMRAALAPWKQAGRRKLWARSTWPICCSAIESSTVMIEARSCTPLWRQDRR